MTNKYIIEYDAGYGSTYEVIESDSLEDAEWQAFEAWNDEVQSSASYGAKQATAVELIELGENPLDYGIAVTLSDCEEADADPYEYGLEE